MFKIQTVLIRLGTLVLVVLPPSASGVDLALAPNPVDRIPVTGVVLIGSCSDGRHCVNSVQAADCTSPSVFRAGVTCAEATGGGVCTDDSQCDDDQLCTVEYCDIGGTNQCIGMPMTKYGDINHGGATGVIDAVCVLDHFSGNPDSVACQDVLMGGTASFQQKDIAPCPSDPVFDPNNTGDGAINIKDAVAALDVFSCSCASPNIIACISCNICSACAESCPALCPPPDAPSSGGGR